MSVIPAVVSVMNVKAPVPATTQDIVFGGDFNGYSYLKVRAHANLCRLFHGGESCVAAQALG